MKISTKYLKSLLSCYEKSFEKRQRTIRKLEIEKKPEQIKVLQDDQLKTEGKMILCKWLIEMSEIPEEEEKNDV